MNYRRHHGSCKFFFFKQKTAYEIGLGIPAEPLFRASTQRRARERSVAIQTLLLVRKSKSSSVDRKSGSAGMPRPISYAVFCLKKKMLFLLLLLLLQWLLLMLHLLLLLMLLLLQLLQ